MVQTPPVAARSIPSEPLPEPMIKQPLDTDIGVQEATLAPDAAQVAEAEQPPAVQVSVPRYDLNPTAALPPRG